MEKILLNKLGQWSLRKSWGEPDYEMVAHGHSPFGDDKNAINNAKKDFIKGIKNHESAVYKKMPNIKSGKSELHVLAHRGVGTEYADQVLSNAKGPNMLDWSNGKTVKTTHNSIHSLAADEAMGVLNDNRHGHYLSFWVPVSSIHGRSAYVNHHVSPEEYPMEHTSPDHFIISPGEYQIHQSIPKT